MRVAVGVGADERGVHQVGGFASWRERDAVAVRAAEHHVGFLRLLHDRIGQRRTDEVDVVAGSCVGRDRRQGGLRGTTGPR